MPRVKWGTKIAIDTVEALRAAAYDTRRDLSDVIEDLIRTHLPARYLDEGRARAEQLLASKPPQQS